MCVQGYAWLKERLHSDEGKKQLSKIKELHLLADRLNCTAAQLAIGNTPQLRPELCLLQCWTAVHGFLVAFLFSSLVSPQRRRQLGSARSFQHRTAAGESGFCPGNNLLSLTCDVSPSTSSPKFEENVIALHGAHTIRIRDERLFIFHYDKLKKDSGKFWHRGLNTSCSTSQVLDQLTPPLISEMDALLGNKPRSKKEGRRSWRENFT